MSGPHRNPDKLNSIGIVVVGICGAVLVYVSIVALQAFYMNDTSEVQTMADYGGQDTAHKSLRAQQLDNIQKFEPHAAPQAPKEGPMPPQTYTISIDDAIPLVVQSAKRDPSNLVPAIGPAVTPTVKPIYGRPHLLIEPAPGAAPPPGGAAPAPAGSEGPGAAAPTGAGSTAPATPPAQPKAGTVPAQPKAGATPATPGAQPKGGATPKKG